VSDVITDQEACDLIASQNDPLRAEKLKEEAYEMDLLDTISVTVVDLQEGSVVDDEGTPVLLKVPVGKRRIARSRAPRSQCPVDVDNGRKSHAVWQIQQEQRMWIGADTE
jgi:serine/threonine protein phosphatase PrpC